MSDCQPCTYIIHVLSKGSPHTPHTLYKCSCGKMYVGERMCKVYSGLGICSFTHRSFAHSNWMSDCEQFAQIAQDKWATVSELIRSLISKEQPWANRSGRSYQKSDSRWLKKSKILFFSMFYITFKMSDSLIPFFLNQRCERIAQVDHQKWANMSKSLRLITKNEQIARFFERITHLLIFLQKTSDWLRKPMSKFPALGVFYDRVTNEINSKLPENNSQFTWECLYLNLFFMKI